MKLDQLEIFINIVDTQSISAAARRMYLSQSSISTSLHQLEEEFGTILIARSRGQRSALHVTRDGQLLYEYAQNTLQAYEQLRIDIQENHSFDNSRRKPIKLIAGQTLSMGIVPAILNPLKKKFPTLPVSLEVCHASDPEEIISLFVARPDVSFILGIVQLDDKNYICEQIIHDPLVLISNRSLKLNPPITIEQLKELPLVLRESGSITMHFLKKYLGSDDLASVLNKNTPVMTQHGATAVREVVKTGPYCGFIPLSLVNSADNLNYYSVTPVTGLESDRTIYLYRRKDEVMTPELTILRRFILGSEWHSYPFL